MASSRRTDDRGDGGRRRRHDGRRDESDAGTGLGGSVPASPPSTARRSADAGTGHVPGAPPPDDPAGVDPPADPESVARTICLRQLDHRARSRSELEQTLRTRGIPDDAAGRVLDRFVEVGLIDDAALAHSMAVAQHRDRGLARRAVAAKLRTRGLDADTVESALTEIDPEDERRRAVDLVTRRQRSLAAQPVPVQMRRLVGLLGRKGYPPGMAYEVVRQVIAEADPQGGDPSGLDHTPFED